MNITPAELKQRLSDGLPVIIIDVREELEYHTYNIGGENIPLDNLASAIENLGCKKDEEIIVICQHGLRSQTGCNILTASGFTNARNLNGGLSAYRR